VSNPRTVGASGINSATDYENRGGSQGVAPRIPQVVESAWPGATENPGQQGTETVEKVGSDFICGD
jgi:hypothetical protein